MPDLLIELFSEEIPARMQARAAEDLKRLMTDSLVEAGLTYAGAAAFSTPRRLALTVQGLLAASPTTREERKGPKLGAPEGAIEGFLRGAGVTRDALELRDEKKGQVYFATITRPGRPATEIVAVELEKLIRSFPWPKSMRWGAGSLRWVRPLHSILCILTDDAGTVQVVDLDVDGIRADNMTEGHRFMGAGRFAVSSFDDYRAKLRRDHVMLDAAERAEQIWQEAGNLAFASGYEMVEDSGLLAEVAGLVEWPVVLMGRIERFVTVANVETPDHGGTILAGNQKVLTARLSDAKFFWENDLQAVRGRGLEGMAEGLTSVTFHNRLGSQAERVARIAALAREIAPLVGADADLAAEAARVCKADLQSEMVGEFPELQGLMGRYYAAAAGLPAEVAAACEEHYKPLGPGDAVPSAPVSVAVALADKIDTLTGFWAIDEKPTGSKDPYALRRAALGVIRLVLGNGLRVSLADLLVSADSQLCEAIKTGELVPEDASPEYNSLLAFLHDRLKVHLRDEGIRHDVIDACLAMPGNDDLTLLVHRARALSDFLKTDDGENLLQGFKRANNILTQAEAKDGVEYSYGADVKFAETDAERALFAALDAAEPAIAAALKSEDFAAAMTAMAGLRAPIDAFFQAVQVNAESAVIRRNRLNLLSSIRHICLHAADLTRIEG